MTEILIDATTPEFTRNQSTRSKASRIETRPEVNAPVLSCFALANNSLISKDAGIILSSIHYNKWQRQEIFKYATAIKLAQNTTALTNERKQHVLNFAIEQFWDFVAREIPTLEKRMRHYKDQLVKIGYKVPPSKHWRVLMWSFRKPETLDPKEENFY